MGESWCLTDHSCVLDTHTDAMYARTRCSARPRGGLGPPSHLVRPPVLFTRLYRCVMVAACGGPASQHAWAHVYLRVCLFVQGGSARQLPGPWREDSL